MDSLDLGLEVSQASWDRLDRYVELLEKWNRKINLVAKSTAADIWERHVADSAQLWRYAPQHVGHWLDLGSGGGLPGLVVAIIGQDQTRLDRMTLVESDQRKSVFLMEVIRELGLPATVKTMRIEQLQPMPADVVSARALADLGRLLGMAQPHVSRDTVLLFPKGAQHLAEVEAAKRDWDFEAAAHPSLTDSMAAVLEIRKLGPRTAEGLHQ